MFWSKKCRNCDTKVKEEWSFCSNCGFPLKESRRDPLQEIDKEMRHIDRMMEMKMPKYIRQPVKAKGVSITITSDNTSPPKINVQAFGEHKHVHHEHKRPEKPVRIPKSTEEPETKIYKTHNKQVITLNLPNVKSLEDIEIKQLDQSMEVKAFAGDKAYFKLIPIPSDAQVNNEFKDGVLKIEVVR